MPMLHIPKTCKQTHKIKIGKSLKRADSDCIFLMFYTLPCAALLCKTTGIYQAAWRVWSNRVCNRVRCAAPISKAHVVSGTHVVSQSSAILV